MHQLFAVPELLHSIFKCLPRKDLVRCARVCQVWSEAALDILWYKVNFIEFTKSLSSVKTDTEPSRRCYVFDPPPGVKAWSRFESKYASRVRQFSCNLFMALAPLLDQLRKIRSSSSQVFPGLRTLTWRTSGHAFGDAIMFMHSQVTECSFSGRESTIGLSDFLLWTEAVPVHMPLLISLRLDCDPKPEFPGPLSATLLNLACLVDVTVPPFEDISQILWSLSSLLKLRALKIRTSYRSNSVVSSLGDVSYREGAFSNMELFRIDVNAYSVLCPFLNHCALHRLRTIQVSSVGGDQSLSHLLQAISRSCPVVTEIVISYKSPNEVSLLDASISFSSIEDILICPQITCFRLETPYLLEIDDHEIQKIAVAWPQIENLDLNPNPHIKRPTDKKLSLWAAFILTRMCPNLRHLGLHINVPSVQTPSFSTSSLPICVRGADAKMTSLRCLDLGNGCAFIPGDEYDFAELLGQICDAECRLDCHINADHVDDEEDYLDLQARWRNVVRVFPRFSRMHSAMREMEWRLDSLEHEVKSYRASGCN
ncbi:hypothetical protein VKT23_018100 [Stygiomarasmius scandens]|uniref:F-box domain-containing protein n=1 Tax=Marasmiellus scandens TaxID=2682957 RepID=A0ABR1IQL9_9AGAR